MRALVTGGKYAGQPCYRWTSRSRSWGYGDVGPATLLASVLALVIGDRPLRTASWFYVGGLGVTLWSASPLHSCWGTRPAPMPRRRRRWVSGVTLVAGLLCSSTRCGCSPTGGHDQMARVSVRMSKDLVGPGSGDHQRPAPPSPTLDLHVVGGQEHLQLDPSTAAVH